MTLIVMKTLERVYKNYYFIIRGDYIMGTNKYVGTKTEKNLWEAFAGESQVRNKYTYCCLQNSRTRAAYW